MASEAEEKVGVPEAPDAEIQADTTADLKSDVLESEPSPAQPATHSQDDTPTQQFLPTHLEATDTEVKVDTAAESKSDAPAVESSSTEATVSRGSPGLSKIAGVLSSSHVTSAQSLHMLVMPSTEDSSQEAQDMHDATSPDLDSLLSPKGTDTYFPIRESVATSDITEDDTRFSTVPLSARQSMETLHLSVDAMTTVAEVEDSDIGDSLYGSEIVRMVHQNRVHKKTPSTSTIVSANNVPFILARLEGDEVSNRKSLDGQQKLQEEFTRKHEVEGEAELEAVVDWGFWGDVVSDYQAYASTYPQQLARAIEKGIPKTLRGMIWQLMSASKDPELEQTYLRLLKESSPHEKAITRDLGRTFPHHAFFTDGQGIGQENLFNVLKAYSLYDTQVGYCQGLPFVAAILLFNMPDEEAFCLLVRLMHSYDLRGHFLPEMPKLQLRMFQFDRLVEEILPVLHVHFIRQGIKSSMYCSQWFLTVFSYKFPLDIVFRIYDNVLASGVEALFSFSLMLLYKNEERLLNMKFDQLLVFLNTRMLEIYQIGPEGADPKTVQYDIDLFVQDAVSMSVTPFMLDQYANEYEELVRTRDAHTIEVDGLRSSNRSLSNQIHNLEENLAQLNTEHVKVLNELVMARLRNEELESELVRYKLLYAEAMHQSEDAMSSHRVSRMSFNRRVSGNSAISR